MADTSNSHKQHKGAAIGKPTKADIEALQGHDPKQVLFITFSKDEYSRLQWFNSVQEEDLRIMLDNPRTESFRGYVADNFISNNEGNPTIYHLSSAKKEEQSDPGVVIRTLREHIRKYGPQSKLALSSHGNSNSISIGENSRLDTRQFLRDLKNLEEELSKEAGHKVKIADHIIFSGCYAFADLDPQEVLLYQDMAHDLNAKITASTNVGYLQTGEGIIKHPNEGRYWTFMPNGEVKQDSRTDPHYDQTNNAQWDGWLKKGEITKEEAERHKNSAEYEGWLKDIPAALLPNYADEIRKYEKGSKKENNALELIAQIADAAGPAGWRIKKDIQSIKCGENSYESRLILEKDIITAVADHPDKINVLEKLIKTFNTSKIDSEKLQKDLGELQKRKVPDVYHYDSEIDTDLRLAIDNAISFSPHSAVCHIAPADTPANPAKTQKPPLAK